MRYITSRTSQIAVALIASTMVLTNVSAASISPSSVWESLPAGSDSPGIVLIREGDRLVMNRGVSDNSRRALDAYRKADEASQHKEPLNYLFLARLVREKFNARDEAKRIAKQGIELSKSDPSNPENLGAIKSLNDFATLETSN
jgi:hypothetical protein